MGTSIGFGGSSGANGTANNGGVDTEAFVARMRHVRGLHCEAKWRTIRAESLEPVEIFGELVSQGNTDVDVKKGRRDWLGYADEGEERAARERRQAERRRMRSDSERRRAEGPPPEEGRHLALEEFRAPGGRAEENVRLCPSDEGHPARGARDEKAEEKPERDDPGDGDGSDERWKGYWEG